MKFEQLILLIGIVLLASACRKTELPPPVEEDPVFFLSADLEGQPVSWTAGLADYYMFTEYRQDSLGVYSFVGRLESTSDCTTDCLESFEVEIRDFQISGTAPIVSVEQSLAPGVWDYLDDGIVGIDTIVEGYEVLFENRTVSNLPLSYSWNYGDNTIDTSQNPAPHFYPPSFADNPPLVSLATASDLASSNCESSISRMLDLKIPNQTNDDCWINFEVIEDSVQLNICGVMTGGVPPYIYEWRVNDDLWTQNDCAIFNIDTLQTISVTGSDAAGCTVTKELGAEPQPVSGASFSYCSADFNYSVTEKISISQSIDSFFLAQVILRYTDPTGQEFSSTLVNQTPQSQFEVLASRDYEDNENGLKTRLLEVRFSALLRSVTGENLRVENASGTIAVAYP